MREILFRGKNEKGKWIEGDLYQSKLKSIFMISRYIKYGNRMNEVVNPETVGQYTGLTDKNGKKIFEGDMIKPFDDEIDKMVVEFRQGQFLLCLYGESGYMSEYCWEESGNYGCFASGPLSSYGDDIEVIGNIHDNPELFKGEEE